MPRQFHEVALDIAEMVQALPLEPDQWMDEDRLADFVRRMHALIPEVRALPPDEVRGDRDAAADALNAAHLALIAGQAPDGPGNSLVQARSHLRNAYWKLHQKPSANEGG